MRAAAALEGIEPVEDMMRCASLSMPSDAAWEDFEATTVFGREPVTGVVRTAIHSAPAPRPSSEGEVLPRLQSDSCPEITTTRVSDLVAELARLSDPSCIPRLMRPIDEHDGLALPEAFLASLVGNEVSVQGIVDMSPMPEEATLKCLAKFVMSRIVVLDTAPVVRDESEDHVSPEAKVERECATE
jgi:hypothetical protein